MFEEYSEEQLKINEGRGELPSFKDELSDEEKWHIIYYIREEAEQLEPAELKTK